MTERTDRYDLDRVVRLILTVAGAVGLFLLARELADILLPLAIAGVLAYLLNPVVTLLERRLRNRTAAVLLTVLSLVVLAATALTLLVPLIVSEMSTFQTTVQQLRDSGSTMARRVKQQFEHPGTEWIAWVVEQIRSFIVSEDFKSLLGRAAQVAVPTAWGVVTGALNMLLALTVVVLVLVYLVFVLIDYRLFARSWKDYLPPTYKDAILDFLGEFQSAMRRYFRGQFIVATITGVLFAIGFKIISLPLGIMLGLFIGLLNMVPYLQAVAFLPACILSVVRAAEQQSSITAALLMVVAVFACVQLLMDGFLSPRILGASVGLRPVMIMLSVFVWGRLLGFFGLVLAIPLSCLGLAYYRRIVLKKKPPIAAESAA